MRIFVSWSGARSHALSKALQKWLETLIPKLELFHSQSIEKGSNWHKALTEMLHSCQAGIFCVTPESRSSHWMLFEAGALAQYGDQPSLFTYLYGLDEAEGPLSHFQATKFEKESSRRFVQALAKLVDEDASKAALAGFDESWPAFEKQVFAGTLLPVEKIIPEFTTFFRDKKTFHESFPDCTNKRWDDRLRRTAKTLSRLSQVDYRRILSADPYLEGAYHNLLSALDRYDMVMGASLLTTVDYKSLEKVQQKHLEEARKQVLQAVQDLQADCESPVFRESLTFEPEKSHEFRKSQIREMERRINGGHIDFQRIELAAQSMRWALDRIVVYISWRLELIPESFLPKLIDGIRIEEQRLISREAVTGLQPLYYALEALDERLPDPIDPIQVSRLKNLLAEIGSFLAADERRDRNGKTRRRVESLTGKLPSAEG